MYYMMMVQSIPKPSSTKSDIEIHPIIEFQCPGSLCGHVQFQAALIQPQETITAAVISATKVQVHRIIVTATKSNTLITVVIHRLLKTLAHTQQKQSYRLLLLLLLLFQSNLRETTVPCQVRQAVVVSRSLLH